ncbi:hypothetical protein [Ornithinimicrobium cerasi]|uniref:Nuclear transport factor 2 family protein n=1 Tax=Ornithinimicrobium cerasi TaxID=2248773 RepID=A0A285VBP5_9MICO|nr:hypothetical protein [Ornithinimicrobium cerasi]SOC51423.1 hypothetical protein SAMN05421879_101189 [Ornithinimicrobium cerasi]
MNSPPGRVLAVVVGILVLLAVVAGVLSATRGEGDLPAGSPEAAVQDYVSRVYDRDLEGAAAVLDPEGGCTVEDLERNVHEPDGRVVLRSSEVDGDTALVRVELVHGEDGPLGSGEWAQEESFTLERSQDRWVITGEPWPVFGCAGPEGEKP